MRPSLLTALTACAVAFLAESSRATVLYDGSLNTSPLAQGLFYGASPLGLYFTTSGGATTLNTSSDEGIYAGFTRSIATTLDRTAGYTLRVDAQVLASTFSKPNRSGFSLIALSSDLKGIELGFHGSGATGTIVALEGGSDPVLQTVAESTPFDFTSAAHRYDLVILGNIYTLKADGNTILSNQLRDYSQYAGSNNVYSTPNFIYLGDDTTSGSATTKFTYVSLVPEPTALASGGAVVLMFRRRRV